MNKNLYTLSIMLAGMILVSCSESDEFNPFDHKTTGEFNPNTITFRKSSENMDIVETWSNIVRNNSNKVTSYGYTREVEGEFKETEKRECTLDYFTDHTGQEVIRTSTAVEFYKSDKGIEEQYTEETVENITLNKEGYITSIYATTDRKNTDGIISTTTSQRTFTYKNNLCTESAYADSNKRITYKYNWNAYQLTNITILKEDLKNNTIEYNTYDYTFDKNKFYDYSGTEIIPFVQSGMPQVYASMGYLGKCTPYILLEEVQGGYTKYAGTTSENIEITNRYNFNVEPGSKIVYSGISEIYNNYSITFSKQSDAQ